MPHTWSTSRASATVANVGPGFDVFCLAIHGPSDRLAIRPAGADQLTVTGPECTSVPTSFEENTAGIVLEALRQATGVRTPFEARLTKGVPAGRGLGSSAASCAAAALAFLKAFPRETRALGAARLLHAAVEGEKAVSGQHYDNVCGALLGGFVVLGSKDPLLLAREPVAASIRLTLAVPEVFLRTAEMRRVIPSQMSLADGVSNVGRASALALALSRGDPVLAGRYLDDRIAEPHRIPLLPGYEETRQAALGAGATGFAISGSGSTVFAISDSDETGLRVAGAMKEAFASVGVKARAFTTRVNNSVPLRTLLGDARGRFRLIDA